VSFAEARSFVRRCLLAVHCSEQNADIISEILVEADARGVHSHGLNRLSSYINEIIHKEVDINAIPTITKETPAIAHVNGNNGLGMPIAHFSMNLAIEKAKNIGVGWVTVSGSNHYGIAGYYSMMAAKHNLIGLSMTNTSPIVYPTRASAFAVGTNPLAVAAPSLKPDDAFDFDMATSAVPLGKVEIADTEKRPVPHGWGVDQDGRSTTDPKAILDGGGLLPLGGTEDTGGFNSVIKVMDWA